jgi:hypothetical protein
VRAKGAGLRAEQSTEMTDEVAAYLAVTQRQLIAGTVIARARLPDARG